MRLAALLTAALASLAAAEPASVVVPFELEANLIWVDVRLDGKGPFRMAFDTGASTTVILPEVAKAEGLLPKGGGTEFDGLKFVNVAALTLGGLSEASGNCA